MTKGKQVLWVLILSLIRWSYALEFWIEQFSQNSPLGLWGDAQIGSGGYDRQLQLNQALNNRTGRALYNTPVTICKNGTPVSFSTNFTFQITPTYTKGDGFAFFLTPHFQASPHGSFGKFLGLLNDSQNMDSSGDFVAVEFDTFLNEFDENSNHVGVDATNITSIKAVDPGISLTGDKVTAWVEYWGQSSKLFKICLSYYDPNQSKRKRCAAPVLEVELDLCSVLKVESVYIGFSLGTQGGVETHNIYSWGFAPDILPLPSKFNRTALVAACAGAFVILLVCTGALFLVLRKMNQHVVFVEKSVGKHTPRVFSYAQLKAATNRFHKDNILGSGGYGTVYRGILKDKSVVAVKCIKRCTEEGERTFVSEASIVGGLEHRNLVRLRGWCEYRRDLFLVYDCMDNGSLDAFLLNHSNVLTWDKRFSIICDLAAALHYLHIECTEPIVHRDIKCSNILLDHDFTAKLGDFGLARLVGTYEESMTTTMGGTIGYLAPELVDTRKPTPASDMYSFGVVVLEIVTGKKALAMKGKDVEVLLEQVEYFFQQNQLLDIVDPNLQGQFLPTEAQQMLMLGIYCVREDPQERMTILDAINLLKHSTNISFPTREPDQIHQKV